MEAVVDVPSSGQLGALGGGAAVSMTPFTCPMLSGVCVYVHGHTAPTIGRLVSWNPVIKVETPVVPIFPLTTVLVPWLVIPAAPPKPPNSDMVGPRTIGGGTTAAPVVKFQGLGAPVFARALPVASVTPLVTVTV